MSIVYLLIGGNTGDRFSNLDKAISFISQSIGDIVSMSSIVESEPWGFSHPDKFLNRVIKVNTNLLPQNLIEKTQLIENKLGRIRNNKGYQARTMDVDILFYDQIIYERDNLIIPHPRLHSRRFTLLPLKEIASDLVHPVLNRTITDLFDNCIDKGEVVALKELSVV